MKSEVSVIETIANIQNEFLFVGAVYTKPDLLIEYGPYTKSKYDFFDEATRFYYDCAAVIYEKRSQTFQQTTVTTFMTEDQERLALYKKYGGWKTAEAWMKLAQVEDVKNYFEVMKKYSLLREYQRNGFAVEKIIAHANFERFTAMDIYRMIRGKADRIHTVILTNAESEVLNTNIIDTVNACLERPDMGLYLPYPICNDLVRGMKLKTMMVIAMLSNAGKSRFLFKLMAYVALVLKEKAAVFLNEMTVEEMRFCLLTTVINNKEFQAVHGIKLTKKERDITLGLYRDRESKEYLYREKDEWGCFTESAEAFAKRLNEHSEEYRNVIKIAEWIEAETKGIIFAKDISAAYDDKTLEFEMRKASIVHGVKYMFYDTLKDNAGRIGDWSGLKITTTKLTELAKQIGVFLFATVQLTDDTAFTAPDELTSNNIANCKQLKHPLHVLMLAKEIEKKDYKKYKYLAPNADWGKPSLHELDETKRYYIFNLDKNRFGDKKKLLFELNLDLNTWYEVGEVFRQGK